MDCNTATYFWNKRPGISPSFSLYITKLSTEDEIEQSPTYFQVLLLVPIAPTTQLWNYITYINIVVGTTIQHNIRTSEIKKPIN